MSVAIFQNMITYESILQGAGSAFQHMLADGGNTQPPLFHAAIFSSLFVPSQYRYDDAVPEVRSLLIVDFLGQGMAKRLYNRGSSQKSYSRPGM